MEEEEPAVTYYALIRDDGLLENANGLVRRTHTKPLYKDEAIGNDLEWHPTDYLDRYYILGTMDRDHVEVSAEFAEALLERWRERRAVRAPGPERGLADRGVLARGGQVDAAPDGTRARVADPDDLHDADGAGGDRERGDGDHRHVVLGVARAVGDDQRHREDRDHGDEPDHAQAEAAVLGRDLVQVRRMLEQLLARQVGRVGHADHAHREHGVGQAEAAAPRRARRYRGRRQAHERD